MTVPNDPTLYGTYGDDVIVGGNGDQVIDASAGGADTISGNNGDDTITGGAASDSISGGNGDDVIDAGGGDGADTVCGGDGDDSIIALSRFSWPGNSIDGGAGDDQITLSGLGGGVTVAGGDGADHFIIDFVHGAAAVGGWAHILDFDVAGGDRLTLNIDGRFVADTYLYDSLYGLGLIVGADFDRYELFFPNMTTNDFQINWINITGSGQDLSGDDTISGSAGNDSLIGGAGADVMNGGSAGADTVLGGDGDDMISVLAGFTWPGHSIDGGEGADHITISGQGGGVTLTGGAGADRVTVDFVHDAALPISGWSYFQDFRAADGDQVVLNVGAGVNPDLYVHDSIYGLGVVVGVGGARYDLFFTGLTTDDYVAGMIDITHAGAALEVAADQLLIGGDASDFLTGGAGDDVLDAGAAGADTVLGGAGDDEITALSSFAWPGNALEGGAGNDRITISGLGGGVTMAGGDGVDQFIIDFAHDSSRSVGGWTHIQDFDAAAGERVTLDLDGRFTPDLYAYDSLHGLGVIVGTGDGARFELFFTGKTLADYDAGWLTIA